MSGKDEISDLNKKIDYYKDLNSNNELKLESLYRLTKAISKNYAAEDIMLILQEILQSVLNINEAVLFIKDVDWKINLNYGCLINPINSKEISTLIKNVYSPGNFNFKNEQLNYFKYIIPVSHKKEKLGFLLIKDVDIEKIVCNLGRFCYITTLLNLTITALENKKLFKKIKSDSKIKEEMQLAAEVQETLIPSVFPSNEFYEFQGKYIPFETVGGDYYDLIKIDDDNIAFCICDVSGKGISAGMVMSNFQASLRTLLSRKLSLIELVKALNYKYLVATKQERYITMFIGKYNIKTRKLEYINAGHNYPVLKNNNDILLLEKGCTIIGFFEELPHIESETIYIENDAILAMYTDGFSEIENEFGIEFGIENITKHVVSHQNKSLKKLTDDFIIVLDKYRGKNEYFDDISLLCAKFPFGKL